MKPSANWYFVIQFCYLAYLTSVEVSTVWGGYDEKVLSIDEIFLFSFDEQVVMTVVNIFEAWNDSTQSLANGRLFVLCRACAAVSESRLLNMKFSSSVDIMDHVIWAARTNMMFFKISGLLYLIWLLLDATWLLFRWTRQKIERMLIGQCFGVQCVPKKRTNP